MHDRKDRKDWLPFCSRIRRALSLELLIKRIMLKAMLVPRLQLHCTPVTATLDTAFWRTTGLLQSTLSRSIQHKAESSLSGAGRAMGGGLAGRPRQARVFPIMLRGCSKLSRDRAFSPCICRVRRSGSGTAGPFIAIVSAHARRSPIGTKEE